MLPNEAILEYKTIYLKTFGIELPFEKAREQSENLFQLFKLIFKPITNCELEKRKEVKTK